jgi:putative transposase
MEETLETCRLLYNELMSEKRKNHSGFYFLQASLVDRKDSNKYLRKVHSQVLQDVNHRLHKAFEAFFEGLTKYPKFKRDGRYNSFTFPQAGGFRVVGGKLRLSKIGSLKMKLHRMIVGDPRRCTVIRDVDKWYAALQVEEADPITVLVDDRSPVGVDVGIITLATLSDGRKFDNPRCFEKSMSEISLARRSLSRKKPGSQNRAKAKVILIKKSHKVRNQRLDCCHKISHDLTTKYSIIVFEDLHIPSMVKNHHLASAIMDAAWGQLRTFTAYKAESKGGRVVLVDPSGTSQKCHRCGNEVPKGLSERVHVCPNCGLVMDRDENAARNILSRGLERASVEEQPLLVKRISKFAPVKQEAHGFGRG